MDVFHCKLRPPWDRKMSLRQTRRMIKSLYKAFEARRKKLLVDSPCFQINFSFLKRKKKTCNMMDQFWDPSNSFLGRNCWLQPFFFGLKSWVKINLVSQIDCSPFFSGLKSVNIFRAKNYFSFLLFVLTNFVKNWP